LTFHAGCRVQRATAWIVLVRQRRGVVNALTKAGSELGENGSVFPAERGSIDKLRDAVATAMVDRLGGARRRTFLNAMGAIALCKRASVLGCG
jgi:hypothetical protein